jgi:hypothetical protein
MDAELRRFEAAGEEEQGGQRGDEAASKVF